MATIRIDNYNSAIIEWAILRKGDSLDGFYSSRGNDRVRDWVNKVKLPTLRQLEELAKKLYIPLGYLFLNTPPEEEEVIPLFRSESEDPVQDMSLNLRDLIKTIKARQDWLIEYLEELGEDDLHFVGSKTVNTPVDNIVCDIRRVFGFDIGWMEECTGWEDALGKLTRRAEEVGIFVMKGSTVGSNNRRSISVSECRGFVLVDPKAPIIFVNSADAKAAQMFTLAHEIAHIWLGESVAFQQDELLPSTNAIERLSDAVAAEFLVPSKRLLTIWEKIPRDYMAISKTFKVSKIVIARRALDLGLITRIDFLQFYRDQSAEWENKKVKSTGGGDYYATETVKLGRRFMSFVESAVHSSAILHREAYRLTGTNRVTYHRLMSRLTT